MRAGIVIAAIVGASLWLAPGAAAQEATGELGGGAVTVPPAPALEAGTMTIGLRHADGGNVQVVATIVGRCASGTMSATVPVAADGSFSTAGAVRQARTTMRYELRGVLSQSPSGSAAASFERTTKTRARRCSVAGVAWEARRPSGLIGDTAAVAPGALLVGTTAQRDLAGTPLGIALRTSASGRSLSRAVYGVRLSCSGAGTSPTFDLPRADLPIGADGHVSDLESGTVTTDASILKYVERFDATLGSTGAEGTFSIEFSVRRRATGKRVTRCTSGDVRWSAST